jgi:hypothetical protein
MGLITHTDHQRPLGARQRRYNGLKTTTQAQGRYYIKRETTPAIFYYYKKKRENKSLLYIFRPAQRNAERQIPKLI